MKDKETLKWIEKARKSHGGTYSYEKTEYLKSHLNVTITCPIHGDFSQIANNHLQGSRCPRCFREFWGGVGKRDSRDLFIQKAVNVHGNTYNYSESIYINSRTDIRIICPKHGAFFKKPKYHIRGEGCPMCAKDITREQISKKKSKYLNTKELLKKELPEVKPENTDSFFEEIKKIMQVEGETGLLKNYTPAQGLNYSVYVSNYKTGFTLIDPKRIVVDWYLPLLSLKSKDLGITSMIIFTDEWAKTPEKVLGHIKKLLKKDFFIGKALHFNAVVLSAGEAKQFLKQYGIGGIGTYDYTLGLCNSANFPMHLACFNKNTMVKYLETFKIVGGFEKLVASFFEQHPEYTYIYRELDLNVPSPYGDKWQKDAEFLGHTIPDYKYKYEDKVYSNSWGNKTHLSKNFGVDKIDNLEDFHKEKGIKKIYENSKERWKISRV